MEVTVGETLCRSIIGMSRANRGKNAEIATRDVYCTKKSYFVKYSKFVLIEEVY